MDAEAETLQTLAGEPPAAAEDEPGRPIPAWRRSLRRNAKYLTLAPVTVYMAAILGVPLILAIWYSLTDISTSQVAVRFVGLDNFISLVHNPVFLQALVNTLIYGGVSTVLTGLIGTAMAFVLLPSYRGKPVVRFIMVLPWTIPIPLSLVGWQWIYDPQFSVINWVGQQLHLMGSPGVQWLGFQDTAMISIIMANVWHNLPFAAIIFVAAIIGVPHELIEAAKVDGAGRWKRLTRVMLPLASPILMLGFIFNMVFNFTDLTIVYLLTQGGPGNGTEILSFDAFQTGIENGQLGQGAAISVFLLPFLIVVSFLFLRAIRRARVAM